MSRLYNKFYRSIFQADPATVKSGSFRRKSASRIIKKQAITEKKGTILIVDISGYTHFVKQADHAAGAQVISSLLSSIIRNNTLGFRISEIEGDAICSINIKMVTHYGAIAEFKVDGFRKIYGRGRLKFKLRRPPSFIFYCVTICRFGNTVKS